MTDFKKNNGFTGSVPQKYIDTKFLKCPLCHSDNPDWHLRMKYGKLKLNSESMNRYEFQCQNCKGVISATVADVTGLGKTAITSFGLMKKISGKETKKTYFIIEDVGNMQATNALLHKEFTEEELLEMSKSI